MTLNPRERFQKAAVARGWSDLVASEQFQQAAETALAQMAMEIPHAPDMVTAAANDFRMKGARQFLAIFMGLAEREAEPKRSASMNLNHKF